MPFHTVIQNILAVKIEEAFDEIQHLRNETPEYQEYTDARVAGIIEGCGLLGDDFYDYLEGIGQREED